MMPTAEELVAAHLVSLAVPIIATQMVAVSAAAPLAYLAASTITIGMVAASDEAVPVSSEARKPNWISNEVHLCLT